MSDTFELKIGNTTYVVEAHGTESAMVTSADLVKEMIVDEVRNEAVE